MTHLKAALVALFLLSVPAAACDVTEADFLNRVGSFTVKMHYITPDKIKILVDNMNALRAKNGRPPLDADELIVGELKGGQIGIVLLKDKCVIPGTVAGDTIQNVRGFFKSLNSENILDGIGTDV